MFDYESDRLFSYTVNLDSPEVIGPVPEGIRANFYVTSGEISGPKLFGKLHPVGGNCQPYAPTE